MLNKHNRGISVLEYTMLIIIILGVLFVMQFYIARAFHGRWKATGESFGFGRQYESGKTVDCVYSQLNVDFGAWYNNDCYRQAVSGCAPGDIPCEDNAKLSCKTGQCCEANDEPAGHSNCD